MISITNLILVFVFALILHYVFNSKRKGKLPPGPKGFPFFGTLFSIGVEPQLTFIEWAKKYGPLIHTKFGWNDVLIMDDAKIIREAFKDPVFSGRQELPFSELLTDGKHGILNSEGQEWIEQRRFVLKTLRDFGFGKQSMENMTMEEVKEFLKWMKENEGTPTAVDQRFIIATVNGLWTIMAGQRHDHDDPVLANIIKTTADTFDGVVPANGFAFLFPDFLNYIPKFLISGYRNAEKAFQAYLNLFHDVVQEHLKDHSEDNPPRDLIDVYLNEVKKTEDPNSSFYKDRGVKTLEIVLNDLYGAAIGTTSSSLTWTVLYLINYPEVQKKLQEELDRVVGKNRMPELADRQNLPYTEALMTEIFRITSITPLSVFHRTMADTTVNGFDVKKGTVVITNLYSVHHNEKNWGDPESFRPERFLSPDGNKFVRSENVMAFGTGKRQCAGEALGRDTFFLFLTSIFQRFQITPDPANPNPTLEAELGILRDAKKFQAVFKDRIE